MVKQYAISKLLLTGVIFISTSVIALAENKGCDSIDHINKLSLGLEGFSYLFQTPNIAKREGNFYGVNGSYSHYLAQDHFLRAEIRLAKGDTKYSSYNYGSIKREPNILLEPRILYNKSLRYSFLDISPYIGFGFRYAEVDGDGKITTIRDQDYFRRSYYYYMPIGLSVNYNLQKDWNLEIVGEYDIFLKGIQKEYIDMTVNKERVNKITFKQSKGYGLRSEILLNKTFDKYIFSIGPYINYWKIQPSNVIKVAGQDWFVAKNKTREVGIKIKFTF